MPVVPASKDRLPGAFQKEFTTITIVYIICYNMCIYNIVKLGAKVHEYSSSRLSSTFHYSNELE